MPEDRQRRGWRVRTWAARLTVIGLLGLATVETAIWATFRFPAVWLGRIPRPVEDRLRWYHEVVLRGAPIQFRPECSEPDPELLYRLRPGQCRFDTDEFDTTVRVSRRYLREDREIANPDLLFLGDSYSMGTGVARESAFPAVLSASLGLREVVVANSSYGTVRELLLLRRLALSDFGVVVLQYCGNDVPENRAYVRAGRHVPSDPSVYQASVNGWITTNKIVFFKRSRFLKSIGLQALRNAVVGRAEEPSLTPEGEALLLLRILGAFSIDLRGRPVLVFPTGLREDAPAFVRAFNEAKKPAGLGIMRAIDGTRLLAPEDYFQLDLHWRATGHARVAHALKSALDEWLPNREGGLWSETPELRISGNQTKGLEPR